MLLDEVFVVDLISVLWCVASKPKKKEWITDKTIIRYLKMKKFCNYIFFFEIRNVYFQNHKKEYKYLWLICGRILFYESVHLYYLKTWRGCNFQRVIWTDWNICAKHSNKLTWTLLYTRMQLTWAKILINPLKCQMWSKYHIEIHSFYRKRYHKWVKLNIDKRQRFRKARSALS